jgi:hypothetical protein
MTTNVQQALVKEIRELLDPIAKAAGDEAVRREILLALNLDPAQASQPLNIPPASLDSIDTYTSAAAEDVDLEAFASVVQDVLSVIQGLESFISAAIAGSTGAPQGTSLNEAVHAFLSISTLGYLRVRQPGAYIGLKALGLLEEQTIRYGGLFEFLLRTGSYLKRLYGEAWTLETEEHAKDLSDGLLFLLGVVATSVLDAEILYGWDTGDGSPSPLADQVSDRTLTLGLSGKTKDLAGNLVGGKLLMSIVLIPKDHQGPAVLIHLNGSGSLEIPLRALPLLHTDNLSVTELDSGTLPAALRTAFTDHEITLTSSATVEVAETGNAWLIKDGEDANSPDVTFPLTRDGTRFTVYASLLRAILNVGAPDAVMYLGSGGTDFPTSTDASLSLALSYTASRQPTLLIGSAKKTHLRFGNTMIEGHVTPTDHGIKATTEQSRLTLGGDEEDGFIKELLKPLPSGQMKIDFDFGIGYSNKRGIFIEGGAGLLVAIPLHRDIGPLKLQTLTLGAEAGEESEEAATFESSISFTARLSALTATVDRIGLSANVQFPGSDKGNLGPVDVQLAFKPPTGVGLSVDRGGFKGGGFLSFDPNNARYAGVLELEYQDRIALKAIGLLTTRLPDGSEGFFLLIVITAEFTPPIQLGFGFNLSGAGGLLGLNHTARVERLRTGIKDNTLDNVLFPENVVANANRIISDLRQVFPPQPDRFIFGPMARINWGTPPQLTIDLGLLIEVPDPVRVVILGVLRASLPEETSRLLQLQVNFLGVIDFQAERLAFDASLFDSRLLGYPLSGDMAVRLSWGADPNFLLTVGGFHPAYQPPPLDVPALARISLQLLGGENPRFRLETYFAVTSNTAQFGARLELYAAAGKFNAYGFLAFDVLFRFNPFHFIADVGAMLALRVGSSSIASINLSMSLEGPAPWHAQGTAKLKLFWFLTVRVRFDKTFGETRNTSLPDVAVLPLLQAALSNRGNWQAEMPTGRQQLVSFKAIEGTGNDIVADPFGVLTIGQKVVPLNVEIQKFGNQAPSDGNRFAIERVRVGPPNDQEDLNSGDVKEQFAPAQFFELSDAEKLSAKSFEQYDAGVKITESEELDADYAARRDVEYEIFYMDQQREMFLHPWSDLVRMDGLAFDTWAVGGAVAASPLSHASQAKSALAPDAVAVRQEPYAAVTVGDLRPVNGDAEVASEAEAISLMRELIRDNPGLEGEIQVVPAFEVNGA